MPSARVSLAPEPQSVGRARRLLRESLATWGLDNLEFAASQALTELATNAVIHARTDFDVLLEWTDGALHVGVEDRSARMPVQRSYAIDAATGRGLRLVNRLCRSWGVERTDAGKRVWFEIADVAGAEDYDDPVTDWSGWIDADEVEEGPASGALARAA
ncbi:MAG: hypothetical protein QOJ03_673 [Frankiaceae bacterium]|nr:hypothetical protein [Frankiaceae bacterium]